MIEASDLGDVISALEQVEEAIGQGYYAAGYLAYEAAPAFDEAFGVRPDCLIPLVWFGIYENPVSGPVIHDVGDFTNSRWESTVTEEQYSVNIRAIREAIARGDTYQANYTMRLSSEFHGDDYRFFECLRDAQNSDYCAYLLSRTFSNPERFPLNSSSI